MKTDRELLELAANAAGYKVLNSVFCEELQCLHVWNPKELRARNWNPLQDDGDAQRLRNKLRMDVFYTDQGVNVAHDDVLLAFEPWGTNDLATERRAITRAAAQMQLDKEK